MPALHLDQMPQSDEVHARRCPRKQSWLPIRIRTGDGSCDPTYADRQWADNPGFRFQLRFDARGYPNFRTTLNWFSVSDLRRDSAADCERQEKGSDMGTND
jgi:hypothetical protein